ncbi:MAG: hypothetical protein ACK424_08160, partial [Candidatus Thermochlorobacter sp.]
MASRNSSYRSNAYAVAHSSAAHHDDVLPVLPSAGMRNDLLPPESIRPLKILFITPKGKKEEDTSQKALFS